MPYKDKEVRKAKAKAYYLAHKDDPLFKAKVAERSHRHYESNKTEKLAQSKQWFADHLDRKRALNQSAYHRTKDRVRAYKNI